MVAAGAATEQDVFVPGSCRVCSNSRLLRARRAAPAPSAAEAHTFAVSLARQGPRPAGSHAERKAHQRVAARFRAVGLRVGYERFSVPGKGLSRDVIGIRDAPERLPGDRDGAHGQRPARARGRRQRVRRRDARRAGPSARRPGRSPRATCGWWRPAPRSGRTPGTPDHSGRSALVARLKRTDRLKDVKLALSLDEVGRGTKFDLHSTAEAPRANLERRIIDAGDAACAGSATRRARGTPTTASSRARARPRRSSAWSTSPAATRRATRPTGSSAAPSPRAEDRLAAAARLELEEAHRPDDVPARVGRRTRARRRRRSSPAPSGPTRRRASAAAIATPTSSTANVTSKPLVGTVEQRAARPGSAAIAVPAPTCCGRTRDRPRRSSSRTALVEADGRREVVGVDGEVGDMSVHATRRLGFARMATASVSTRATPRPPWRRSSRSAAVLSLALRGSSRSTRRSGCPPTRCSSTCR